MKSNRDYATENINLKQQVIDLKVSNKDKAETIKAMKQELLEYNQLRDRFKVLYEENEKLKNENQELKEKADKYDELCKHNVMESQSFGDDLIQGILALNKRVIERNKKFIKIIKILKNYIEYWTFGAECDFDTYVTSQCTEEEQDLLKEVLEYDQH